MSETSATLIAGAIGIFGTLSGVTISQCLTMSRDRTQRIADAKQSECRELLKALSHCVVTYVRSDTEYNKFDEEQKRERANAAAASLEAIWVCMFITKELDEHKIAARLLDIVEKYDDDPDWTQFMTDAYSITYDIAAIAVASENKKTRFGRKLIDRVRFGKLIDRVRFEKLIDRVRFGKLIDRVRFGKLIDRVRFEKLIDRAMDDLEELSGVVAQLTRWTTHRRNEGKRD
jgi:hypothetical protein